MSYDMNTVENLMINCYGYINGVGFLPLDKTIGTLKPETVLIAVTDYNDDVLEIVRNVISKVNNDIAIKLVRAEYLADKGGKEMLRLRLEEVGEKPDAIKLADLALLIDTDGAVKALRCQSLPSDTNFTI